jgi:hypothetical protein
MASDSDSLSDSAHDSDRAHAVVDCLRPRAHSNKARPAPNQYTVPDAPLQPPASSPAQSDELAADLTHRVRAKRCLPRRQFFGSCLCVLVRGGVSVPCRFSHFAPRLYPTAWDEEAAHALLQAAFVGPEPFPRHHLQLCARAKLEAGQRELERRRLQQEAAAEALSGAEAALRLNRERREARLRQLEARAQARLQEVRALRELCDQFIGAGGHGSERRAGRRGAAATRGGGPAGEAHARSGTAAGCAPSRTAAKRRRGAAGRAALAGTGGRS